MMIRKINPLLVGALAFGLVVLITYMLEYFREQEVLHDLRTQTISELSQTRARLETELNLRLHLIRGLVAFQKTQISFSQEEFREFAEELRGEIEGIRSLQLAPRGVIEYVYPIEGNENILGHDLLADVTRRDAVNRAIENNQFIISGPINLIQGGRALIGRSPIYYRAHDSQPNRDAFWGFATILLELDPLFRDSGLLSSETGIEYAIRGKDGLGENGEVFFGQENIYQNNPVYMNVSLPVGSWQIAAVPIGGWAPEPGRKAMNLFSGMFLAVLIGWLFTYTMQMQQRVRRAHDGLELRVAEKTIELSENRAFLRLILDNTDNALLALDDHLHVTFYNHRYLGMWQLDPSFLDNQPHFSELIEEACRQSLYPSESSHEITEMRIKQLVELGQEDTVFLPRIDGVVLESYSTILPGGGYLISIKDVTEHRNHEDRLSLAKRRYEHLFQGAEVGIIEMDLTHATDELFRCIKERGGLCGLQEDPGNQVVYDGIVNEMKVTAANQAALDMLGYEDSQSLQDNLTFVLSTNSGQLLCKYYSAHISGDHKLRSEIVLKKKDGDPVYVIVSMPVSTNKMDVAQVPVSIQDITYRKRAEIAIQELAQMSLLKQGARFYEHLTVSLSNLFDIRYVLIAIADKQSQLQMRTVAILADGMPTKNINYSLDGTPFQGVLEGNSCIYPEGVQALFPKDSWLINKEVESYLGIPLLDSSGRAIGVLALLDSKPMEEQLQHSPLLSIYAERIAVEIEREQSQVALRESESLFRSVFESAAIGMAQLDLNGKFMMFNHSFASMFGWSEVQLISMTIQDLTHPEDLQETLSRNKKLINGFYPSESYSWEKRYFRKDKTVIYGDVTVALVRDKIGKPLYLIAEVQDITLRAVAESERTHLENQLRQSQKMDSIGQLTGGIAHDFNNILAAILGYTGLALERFATDEESKLRTYLKEIARAGERARDLIAQMLAFSRRSEGEAEKVMVQTVVKEVVKLMLSTLPSTMTVHHTMEDADLTILIDQVQLHQVLMNLSINARDAMDGKGDLMISVRREQVQVPVVCASCNEKFSGDNFVVISVKDQGEGVDASYGSRIFEPFFTTKEVGSGTGMGLSVVHGIVHGHHGHILVESNSDFGSVFQLYFPEVEPEFSARLEEEDVFNQRQLSGHIMVVDDEAVIVDLIRELLEMTGCKVTTYTDSERALEAFRQAPDSFDIIISDQTMPGLTGVELIEQIRTMRPDIPVLLCTGYSNKIDADKAAELGINQFLMKPVDSRLLISSVEPLLRGSEG